MEECDGPCAVVLDSCGQLDVPLSSELHSDGKTFVGGKH